MSLGLRESLASLVRAKYATAKASEALTFAPSELAVVRVAGALYQLRFCPSLAKKPTPHHDDTPKPKKPKPDPFDNPDPALLVADIPHPSPTHALILNKFPIIAHHFILATKAAKPQTHLLEQDDLWLTYECLRAWASEGGTGAPRSLYAFFNSGPHSGASQAHRHIQLLPVEDMRHGAGDAWDVLADVLTRTNGDGQPHSTPFPIRHSLPFAAFAARLPTSPTASDLHTLYRRLYEASADAVRDFVRRDPDAGLELHSTDSGDAAISYNVGMTRGALVVCPRRSEGRTVRRDDGFAIDDVALNGTVLAGTMMVKNRELFEVLRDDAERLEDVLSGLGIPVAAAGTADGRL